MLAGHASIRSHRSSSALADPKVSRPLLQRTSLPVPLLKRSNGHKTHGSNNALYALSHSPSQSSRLLSGSVDCDPRLSRHKTHGSTHALQALSRSPSPTDLHLWSQSSSDDQELPMPHTPGSSTNASQAPTHRPSPGASFELFCRNKSHPADLSDPKPSRSMPSPSKRVSFSTEGTHQPTWPCTPSQTPGSMPASSTRHAQHLHQTDSQTSGSLPTSSPSSSEGQDPASLLSRCVCQTADTSPISVLGSRWPAARQCHDGAESFTSPR